MTINQINKLINNETESKIVKLFFKERDQRLPMIGKFVMLSDSKSLSSKGMVRFVSQGKLGFPVNIGLTKIYVVSDFSQIRDVTESDKVFKPTF